MAVAHTPYISAVIPDQQDHMGGGGGEVILFPLAEIGSSWNTCFFLVHGRFTVTAGYSFSLLDSYLLTLVHKPAIFLPQAMASGMQTTDNAALPHSVASLTHPISSQQTSP